MNRTPKLLVGLVATLSLLGLGGVVGVAASPDAPVQMSATRWCC